MNVTDVNSGEEDKGADNVLTQSGGGTDRAPVPGPEVPEEAMETDYGNALRFKFYFALVAFFHHAEKIWFRWTGSHWERDIHNSVTSLVVQAIQQMLTVEIPWVKYQKEKQKKDLGSPSGKWVCDSLNRSKIKAAALLAADLLPLTHALDSHKYLLNVQNGTIDLKNGEIRPHNREDYITKIAPISYIAGSQCPKFMNFLNTAFPNNPIGIRFIQKMFGYALTGDVSEKRFFILWGAAGNNGKTMLFNIIRAILGAAYRVQLSSESLVSGRISSIRSDLAKLKAYRFVTASETDKRYKFNEALIKLLTGGDTITARHPHEKEIEFEPELKLFLATNAKPEFTLSDEAMMNRVVIIPFHVSIPEKNQNKKLTQELIGEEGPGILAWLVEGAAMWAQEGLGDNPFDQAEAAIIKHAVTIEEFLEKCCSREDKNSKTKTTDLFKAYNAYKTERGDSTPDMSEKQFGQLLTAEGIQSKRQSDAIYRLCIVLNPKGTKLLAAADEVQDVQDVKDENDAKAA